MAAHYRHYGPFINIFGFTCFIRQFKITVIRNSGAIGQLVRPSGRADEFIHSSLLFAGVIHIDASKLKQERWPVLSLATIGILISTFLVGGMT